MCARFVGGGAVYLYLLSTPVRLLLSDRSKTILYNFRGVLFAPCKQPRNIPLGRKAPVYPLIAGR